MEKYNSASVETDTPMSHFLCSKTQLQRAVILKQIERINYQNFLRFKVDNLIQSSKKKTSSQINHLWLRADFPNGWWCHYTDNKDAHSSFKFTSTILTVHGCPGTDLEWRSLEKAYGNNTSRFINFIVPGFDGESEIRGDYTGTESDICKMIVLLMNHLKIEKIMYCGHSMGGFIMYKFFLLYPNRVNGLIHMAAPIWHWYVGIKVFYGLVYVHTGFAKHPEMIRKLSDATFRKLVTARLHELSKDVHFEGKSNLLVKFPVMKESEVCAFVKLASSWNLATFPAEGRKSRGILRFLAAGKHDPLLEVDEYAEQFFEIINDKSHVDVKVTKEDLEGCEELKGTNLNLENLQENFMFLFEKTGHNLHKKYGRVLGHLIRKYVAFVELLERKRMLNMAPKL